MNNDNRHTHKQTKNELYETRDEWLMAGAELATEHVLPKDAQSALQSYRVSCGFPIGSRPGKGGKRTTLGVCHNRASSSDNTNEIWITPEIDTPEQVLSTLVHELIHAADDCQHGHKGPFAKWARQCGLEGPLTSTHAGPSLTYQLNLIIKALGPYPHASISTSAKKKQATRMRKISCGECQAVWRASAKWADQMIACPVCASESITVE
jgi:hypothetical protein